MIITKLCHKYKYVQAICLALLIPLMLLEDVLTAIWEGLCEFCNSLESNFKMSARITGRAIERVKERFRS
jgi:acyl-CoA synthetase (AMP-forming)/AMP-acid ligase II